MNWRVIRKILIILFLVVPFALLTMQYWIWLLPPSPLFYIAILIFLVIAIVRGTIRRKMQQSRQK